MGAAWKGGKRDAQLGVPITVGVRLGEHEQHDVVAALNALDRAGFYAGPTSTPGQFAQTVLTLRTIAVGRGGDDELEQLAGQLEAVEVRDGE